MGSIVTMASVTDLILDLPCHHTPQGADRRGPIAGSYGALLQDRRLVTQTFACTNG